VRVLLDANLPRALGALLPGHRVDSVHARRWSDLDDGPLLDAAEREYEAFITADQNLRFQQNLRGRTLRILVLRAPRTSLPALAPLASAILAALPEMTVGELRIVAA
jgi:predicted nuclease of predicted toxin-antitoxin system